MANRFVLPLETPVDATGAPYPGGFLFFYASGTSTKLNTYSDEALTIPNSNPVVLDSAGRFPDAIFLQNLAYKVVLSPSTDSDPPTSPIWTQDPVYASDYSTVAQFASGNGSPNGIRAGTQGSATIPASVYWDYANNILYVCTTTGTTTTAVWTAVNAASAAAVITPPQGYLTPVSGVPIITTDSVAATAVYYTPYVGLLVPIYNGTSFVPTSIVSQLQLTLVSSHTASDIYDFYIFLLNGVATLGTGPSWSAGTGGSITAGTCARGTGTGGAALTMLQGVLTNAVSMTMRYGNGTTTTTVAANQATYVGSMFVDGTNGQVSCYRTWGQSRKWGIWNAYNRQRLYLQMGDNTASWTYGTNTIRQSNGAAGNTLAVFCGLASETAFITSGQAVSCSISTGTGATTGIGLNSTTAYSGQNGFHVNISSGAAFTEKYGTYGSYALLPSLGLNNINFLESGNGGGGTTTFYGTNASMQMTATYNG